VTPARWPLAAAVVCTAIEAGELRPGQVTLSALSLAASAGLHVATCRRALLFLAEMGILQPPASLRGRPRVPGPDGRRGRRQPGLPAALAAARRAAGLTQRQLAGTSGLSLTTVHHAETGWGWQSAAAWARLDQAAGAGGKLARMHAGCREWLRAVRWAPRRSSTRRSPRWCGA
jgi:DNA-binding XRE family transcriptional regulator